MQRTLVRFGLSAIAALGLIFASMPAPAAAVGLIGMVQGTVTDAATGLPITNACVWFGPVHLVRTDPLTNCTFTNGAGFYSHTWINGPATIPLTFERDPSYLQKTIDTIVNSDSPVVVNAALDRNPGGPPPGPGAGCQAALQCLVNPSRFSAGVAGAGCRVDGPLLRHIAQPLTYDELTAAKRGRPVDRGQLVALPPCANSVDFVASRTRGCHLRALLLARELFIWRTDGCW